MNHHRITRLLATIIGVVCVRAATTDWTPRANEWWKHVTYLASDALEGRNVGSQGYEKAAAYVAEQFRGAGLTPGASNGYFQPVPLLETSLNRSESRLYLIRDGREQNVAVPDEALLGYSSSSIADLTAPIVFAGYGLVVPEAHFDDLKGLPAKGALVVYLTGGPKEINGNLRSHYSSAAERWKAFRAAGAVGAIAIANPKNMEIPWKRQALAWGLPRVSLADTQLQAASGEQFSASWNPAYAEDLFEKSGHSFAQVLEASDKHQQLPHFQLNGQLKAHVSVSHGEVKSKNVVGIREGSDPKLRNEFVVISAHLDHLGIGTAINGDAIYNGAMDDASGVASLISIATSLHEQNTKSKRSMIFLAVTGEEKGELGSMFFAAHPTVAGKIVADLNMDMYLPLFPLKWLEVQGLNESTLGDDIRAVARMEGVKVQADKEPDRNRFIRSDQYSFVKRGVPALAFKFGYQLGDPEEKTFKDWYANRYHGVSDDLEQPVDKEAAAQFNSILQRLALRVASAKHAPRWNEDSFFKRFAEN
jgi:hypothetical protein